MSLFKDRETRNPTKAKMKTFLFKNVSPSEPLTGVFRTIADGGEFLWCCKWKTNDLFGHISEICTDLVRKFGIDAIVFDACAVPTKDYTHQKQTGKKLNIVDIRDDNPCSGVRELFFVNYSNKEEFNSELARKLDSDGVSVVMCSRDGNTTVVKVSLQIEEASALALKVDTDNLCLLIQHFDAPQRQHDTYIKNMTRRKAMNEYATESTMLLMI